MDTPSHHKLEWIMRKSLVTQYGGKRKSITSEFGGTFVSRNIRRIPTNTVLTSDFMPEVLEDEERLALRRWDCTRFVAAEEIPATVRMDEENLSWGLFTEELAENSGPRHACLQGTLEDTMVTLLKISPRYTLEIYRKARFDEDLDRETNCVEILTTLERAVKHLILHGVYTLRKFQDTKDLSTSCYKSLQFFAEKCPIARAIYKELNTTKH